MPLIARERVAHRGRAPVIVALVVVAIAGCDPAKKGATGGARDSASITTLPAGHPGVLPAVSGAIALVAKQALDSGNIAFRAARYDDALEYYSRAAAHDPKHPAPWFGIYMVGQKVGNKALADSALAMVRQRSPSSGPSTDTATTLLHPSVGKQD